MGKGIDLLGQKFGRWTVIKREKNNKNNERVWLCQCECGHIAIVRGRDLITGKSKSCGCYRNEVTSNRTSTHNLSKNKLYKLFYGIKQRCYEVNHKSYKYYGGKGIKICDEWLNDFQKFYDWSVANGYDKNAKYGECTIDRIDTNKDYSPENCRWVSMNIQNKNKGNNRLITYNGETHCLKEWSEKLMINCKVLNSRINKYGWSIERAFTTPVRKLNKIAKNSQ